MAEGTCRVDGCDRDVLCREVCEPHYQKLRRYGDPNAGYQLQPGRICSVPDCDVRARSGGMCKRHYGMMYVRGTVAPPRKRLTDVENDRVECSKCHAIRPAAAYSRSRNQTAGLNSWCRMCRTAGNRARYLRDPDRAKERVRWASMKARFGLTREQFEAVAESQGNVCAICRQPETDPTRTRLTVDHDHACCPSSDKTCGKCIRGLLCNTCNRMLGIAGDDPQRLRAAAAYLGG